ncbi:MAG TPA: DEAD/DEAH box helicase [Thermodesulfobacteriota bacterium]|nr:DEAD/DEAH box helicase [Thermodesulfobacteriota bacterium]
MKFSELGLKPEILRALTDMGYEELTPIQEKTFSSILDGKDLLARAETGSGKTAACGIPLVQKIDSSFNAIQALILVPTRELALQYVEEISRISKYMDVVPFAVFGGFSMEIQKGKLKDRVHILVATPGRLIDFLYNTTSIDLSHVQTLVLDEADEMLKMGFIEDIDLILSCLIHQHQTLFFAATMPEEINRLTRAYLKEPIRIELNKEQVAPESLAHHFQYTKRRDRLPALIEYLEKEKVTQAIIFCNSRHHGATLKKELEGKFKSIEYIHGGLEQSRRTSIFERFRQNRITLMVATDVAGRGLDFTHVSHVINYDYPDRLESYTHRTGRTGRMGRSGIAMTFVTDQELEDLKSLLKTNRIDPVWHGNIPNLQTVHHLRREGKRILKKRPLPVSRGRTPSYKRKVVSLSNPSSLSSH